MARRKKIYEGKAKILYEGPEPGTLVQYFKDDATAGNGAKKEVFEGKGVLNNRMSEFFMAGLNQIGVPTHFIRRLNMREQLVRQVEIIPARGDRAQLRARLHGAAPGPGRGPAASPPDRGVLLQGRPPGRPLVPEEYIIAFGCCSLGLVLGAAHPGAAGPAAASQSRTPSTTSLGPRPGVGCACG
jgi:phosphoribosylaminoimidazole-succinocarboxamide synthase